MSLLQECPVNVVTGVGVVCRASATNIQTPSSRGSSQFSAGGSRGILCIGPGSILAVSRRSLQFTFSLTGRSKHYCERTWIGSNQVSVVPEFGAISNGDRQGYRERKAAKHRQYSELCDQRTSG